MLNRSVETTVESYLMDATPRRQNYYPSHHHHCNIGGDDDDDEKMGNRNVQESQENNSIPPGDERQQQWQRGWTGVDLSSSIEEQSQPRSTGNSGILIVPAGPDDDDDDDDDPSSPTIQSTENVYQAAMDLSLPGTESLPSDIGSLKDPNPRNVVVPVPLDDDRGRGAEDSAAGAAGAAAAVSPTTQEENKEDEAQQVHAVAVTTVPPEVDHNDQSHGTQVVLARFKRQNQILSVVVIVLVCSVACLVYERFESSKALVRLEEQIHQLKLNNAVSAASKKTMEAKKEQLTTQKKKESYYSYQFPWETCNSEEEEEKGTTIVDNCWLHAKANVELGQCANDAKQTVKTHMDNFGNFVWKAQEQFWETVDEWNSILMEDEGESPDSSGRNGGKKRWSGAGTGGSGNNVSTRSSDDKNFKFTNAATTIVSGLAYASVGALVADQVFSFLGDAFTRASAPDHYD